MLNHRRIAFATTAVTVLLAGNGCLHSIGDWKSKSSPTNEPQFNEKTVQTKVDAELAAKPAAILAFTMAEQLEKAGKDTDAIPFYEKARANDPALNPKVSRRLAVLYDRVGESSKAMNEFQELLKSRPKDADLLNDLGYSFYNRGNWSESETHLRKALDTDKHHKRAWVNLGMTLAQQGRYPESITAFEKAITPAEAKANLAFVLATQGKRDEATALYQEALNGDSTLKAARLGLTALEKEQLPEKPEVPDAPTPVVAK